MKFVPVFILADAGFVIGEALLKRTETLTITVRLLFGCICIAVDSVLWQLLLLILNIV
jgi:hypothetical protein